VEVKANKLHFFIVGYFGMRNTGDDAMLYGLLTHMGKAFPKATFNVIAARPIIIPESVANKVSVSITSHPISYILKTLREISRCNVILNVLGSSLYGYKGNKRYIRTLGWHMVIVLCARILRKLVYMVNIGIGPLPVWWSRIMTTVILKASHLITVRDMDSYYLARRLGVRTDMLHLSFDLSVLIPEAEQKHSRSTQDGINILGISILPYHSIYERDPTGDLHLVQEMAKALNRWLRENDSRRLKIFIFRGLSKEDDCSIAHCLAHLIRLPQVEVVPYNPDPNCTLAEVKKCDAFVSMKLHSAIFAYLAELPQLVVTYLPKCLSFAKEIGMQEIAMISIEEILQGKFFDMLSKLVDSSNLYMPSLTLKDSITRTHSGLNYIKQDILTRCSLLRT